MFPTGTGLSIIGGLSDFDLCPDEDSLIYIRFVFLVIHFPLTYQILWRLRLYIYLITAFKTINECEGKPAHQEDAACGKT
jgi:hypothetical protein